jgi:hypothetical protein
VRTEAAQRLDESNVEEVIRRIERKPGGRRLSDEEKAALRRQAKNKGEKWNLDDKLRGEVAHVLADENLPRSFPTIDRFDGVDDEGFATEVTSIKSHKLYASSFQEPNAFYKTMVDEIDALAAFKSEFHDGVLVRRGENTKLVLEIEVPKGSLSTARGEGRMYDLRLQWATEAKNAKTYAQSKHVKLVFKTTR